MQNHMSVIKFQLDDKSRWLLPSIHRNISSQTLILELDFQKSPLSWKLFKTASLDPPQKLLAHSRSSSLAMLLGVSPSTWLVVIHINCLSANHSALFFEIFAFFISLYLNSVNWKLHCSQPIRFKNNFHVHYNVQNKKDLISPTKLRVQHFTTSYWSAPLKGLCHPTRMRKPMKTNLKFCRRFWKAVFICLNLSHRSIVSEVLY